MKSAFSLILFLLLIQIPFSVHAKTKIVATLPVYAAIAREIALADSEILSLTKPGIDPHFVDAKPSLVVHLASANALVHSGLELENGWLPVLLAQSKNPAIQEGHSGNINLAHSLTVLEIPSGNIDRSQGDIHASGNPHAWLHPVQALQMATKIEKNLELIDPVNAATYQQRLSQFRIKLEQASLKWHSNLNSLNGKRIYTFHKSLIYLCDFAKIICAATMEPKPGIPPNSRHFADLVSMAKTSPVDLIVQESFYPRKFSESLSQTLGVKLLIIDNQPLAAENYITFMSRLLQNLAEGI